MSDTARATSAQADTMATSDGSPSPGGLLGKFRMDHRNPINHFLHVGVGYPMMAVSILLLPFRPLWSAALFVSAYAILFFGHFVFERNVPTVFKQPSIPFVLAYAVIRDLWGVLLRLVKYRRAR